MYTIYWNAYPSGNLHISENQHPHAITADHVNLRMRAPSCTNKLRHIFRSAGVLVSKKNHSTIANQLDKNRLRGCLQTENLGLVSSWETKSCQSTVTQRTAPGCWWRAYCGHLSPIGWRSRNFASLAEK